MEMIETYNCIIEPINTLGEMTDAICIDIFALGEDYEKLTYGMKLSESIKFESKLNPDNRLDEVKIKKILTTYLNNIWFCVKDYLEVGGDKLDIDDVYERFLHDDLWFDEIERVEFSTKKPGVLNNEEMNKILKFYDAIYEFFYYYGKAFRQEEFAKTLFSDEKNKESKLNELTFEMYPDLTVYFIRVYKLMKMFEDEMYKATGIEMNSYELNRYANAYGRIKGLRI